MSEMNIKISGFEQENSRLRQRLTEVITEGDEAIRTIRQVKAENNKLKKDIFILEKKEPGLYFQGLETVAAFEDKIANLEHEKARLAWEKFEIIGSLAKALKRWGI